jgi:hypothetical protein
MKISALVDLAVSCSVCSSTLQNHPSKLCSEGIMEKSNVTSHFLARMFSPNQDHYGVSLSK